MGGLIFQRDNTGDTQVKLKLKQNTDLTDWTTTDEVIWNTSLPAGKSSLQVSGEN
jgi:hypothetical protein